MIIKEKSKDINCFYIGKGERVLSIPKRDNEIWQFYRILKYMSQINENELSSYSNFITPQEDNNLLFQNEKILNIKMIFDELENYQGKLNVSNSPLPSTNPPTEAGCCMTANPPILCKLLALIFIILGALGIV